MTILTYHKIGRQFEIGIASVPRPRFRQHVEIMVSAGRPFARARDVVTASGITDQIALTFDDGYETVYTEALPEMMERGIAGTVFPVAGAIGDVNRWDVRLSPRPFRHLTWPQLRDLAKHGFEVGSHTMSHRDLTRLTARDLLEELAASKILLEDRLGVAVASIAYPFGKVNRMVIEAALRSGYTCGFLSSPRPAGEEPKELGHAGCAREENAEVSARRQMAVGRMSVYSIDHRASLLRKLGGVPGYRFEALKNRVIARLSHGTTLIKK